MKKNLKRFVASVLTVIMMLSIVPLGNLYGLDLGLNASAVSYVTVSGHTVVDTITFNGHTIEAVYTGYYGLGYNSDTTYCCAAFVSRFYRTVYGVTVSNLISTTAVPNVSTGSFTETRSPQVGDIVRRNYKSSHWMIVKAVSGTTVTLIEQNFWDSPYKSAPVNRTIQSTDTNWSFFRYSDADNPITPNISKIWFHGVTNPDNTSAGIDPDTTFTINGEYRFWFKENEEDTNYYINAYLDEQLIADHCSSDGAGLFSCVIDTAYLTNGEHELKVELVYTNGSYTATKKFVVNNDIVFWGVTNPDNSSAGIEPDTAFTINGEYKFWFKETNEDTNYYINLYVDNQLVKDHVASDSSGYVTCTVNTAYLTNGTHEVKAVLCHSTGAFIVIKKFKVEKLIDFFSISDVDNVSWNLSNTSMAGTYKFWFKEYNDDPNYYINLYLDNKLVEDHIASDSDGYVSYVVNTSELEDGNHELKAILNHTNGGSISIKQFNVVNKYYTLTFNANGGTTPTASKTVTYDSTYGTLPTPTRTGYTFNGWYTATSGGTKVTADTKVTTASNHTLYAQWTANGYTIAFNGNGATSGSMSSLAMTYGTAKNLTANAFVKTGYTFNGWNTKADGSGTSYADKASVNNLTSTKGATVTLYAQWTANTNTKYVVNHYQMNVSGSGYTLKETENKTGTTASSVTLANLKKTYTGFTYEGGKGATAATATKPSTLDTTTTVLADGTRVVNIYYSRNKYALTLNKGTGISAVSGAGTYYYGQSVTIDATVTTGYTWSKWSDGNTTKKATITMPANALTITAKATLNSYTISYTLNGGTVATANPTSYNVTTADFTLNNPTRTGYTFAGWTGTGLSAATKNVTVAKGSTGNRSYTATWTANTYTVTFDANGGTVQTPSKSATFNSTYGTLPTATRTGYTFNGWYTAASGGAKVTADTKVTTASDHTLYAQWTANTYTIAFNGNGATSGSMSSLAMTYGTSKNLTANAFAKTGYSFNGWNTKADGSGTSYADKASVNNLTSTKGATVTLYAQWKCNHSYKSAVTKAATCTADGVRTYTCQTCGHSYTETIAKIGHNYKSVVTAPTCTKDGYTTHTCANCNDSYTDSTVKATGHKWKDATCTAAKTCSVCGATSGSALGHSYTSAVTKAATCTADGVRTYTCQTCGHSYTEAIAKIGHNYKSVVTAPTCTKDGYTTHTCANCNDSYTDLTVKATGHKWNDATCTVAKTCSVCGTTSGSALGHSYTSAVTKAATCTADGVRIYTCQTCGHSYTEAIAKIGHNYKSVVTEPTCTTDGYTTHTCENCNYSFIDSKTVMTGHSFDDWFVVYEPSCTASGVDRRECSVCGTYENRTVKAYGHLYEDDYTIDVEATFTSAGSKSIHCALCDSRINVTEIPKVAQNCIVDNGFVYGFASGLTKEDLLNDHFNENAGKITINNAIAGTGTVVTKTNESGLKENLSIVIFGDVNGDSWYDGQDAVIVDCLANGMLTKEDVGEAVYMAADCNHDGVIDQLDVYLLNEAGALLSNVDQSKPAEVLMETSSAYVDYLSLIDQSFEIEDDETEEIPELDTDVESEETAPEQDNAEVNFFDMIMSIIKSIIEMLISYIPVPIK